MNTQKPFHNHIPQDLYFENVAVIACDKDNTITPANKPMDPGMAKVLSDITRQKIVVILTARDFATCQKQILEHIAEHNPNFSRLIFGCSNGSQIFRFNPRKGEFVKKSELQWDIEIDSKKEQLFQMANEFFGRDDMQIEQRSSTMAAICPPRTLTDQERKNFDPTGEKRKNFIAKIREAKIFPENYEIIVGGSTSIDIGLYDKESGMRHLIKYFGYSIENHGQILFFGDGFPGNDSPVLRIPGINIVKVDNEKVTEKILGDFIQKFL